MKLIPKEIEAILPPLYSQENVSDPVAVIKIFDPCGRCTFYILEGSRQSDGDLLLFGFCRSALGKDCDELGYASLRELESVRRPLGLGFERDHHFAPTPVWWLMQEVGYRDLLAPPPTLYPNFAPAPMWFHYDAPQISAISLRQGGD